MQRNAQVHNRYLYFIKIKICICFIFVVTPPMEAPTPPPPTTVYVPQVPTPVEKQDKSLSPLEATPRVVVDQSTEPAPSRLTNNDDTVELMKATYEDKISKLHESYQ